MTTPTSGATQKHPTHHVTLADGSTTLGLMVVDGNGKENPLAIRRTPYPRTATRIAQGGSKYADFEPPYKPVAQDNWIGGRGADTFEKDQTKYADSYRVNTETAEQVILNGQETYGTYAGMRQASKNLPGSVYWTQLEGTNQDVATKFVPAGNITVDGIYIWVRRKGTPAAGIRASIWSHNAGSDQPNVVLAGTVTAKTTTDITDTLAELQIFSHPASLTGGVTYWVVVEALGTPDSDNCWVVGMDDCSLTSKASEDGTTWAALTDLDLYYYIPTSLNQSGFFLEYKRQMYFVSQPDNGGSSVLYMNGDRGAADNNVGALTTLIDATKTWTADEWIGCVVLLINGTGSEEPVPWRAITDSAATTLTVSPAWNIQHDTDTEYVIIQSNKWTAQYSLPDYCFDAEVAGDYIYFCFGDGGSVIRKYIEQNLAGVWTAETCDDVERAVKLLGVQHPSEGNQIWGARNDHPVHGACVWKATVPRVFGNDTQLGLSYNSLGVLASTSKPWASLSVSGVTHNTYEGETRITVAAATTGNMAVTNLDAPVDLMDAYYIGLIIKSSVATAAGVLKLLLDDVDDLGRTYIPDYLFYWDKEHRPSMVLQFDTSDASLKYAVHYNAGDDNPDFLAYIPAVEASDLIYIGCPVRFNTIRVVMGATVNNNAATITAEYFNGRTWTAVTGWSDGTENPAGTTLARSGVMTFTLSAAWEPGFDTGHADFDTFPGNASYYWLRLDPSADTDPVDINELGLSSTATGRFLAMANAKDGDAATTYVLNQFKDDDYLYVGHSVKFNQMTVDVGATPNAIASTLTCQYFNGSAWTALTITDGTAAAGATLAVDGSVTWTIPYAWALTSINNASGYWLRFKVSADLTANVILNSITITRQNNVALSIPALTANEATWVNIAITPTEYAAIDYTAIKSVGISRTNADNPHSIYLYGDVLLLDNMPKYIQVGDASVRINGLEKYGDERENPWVLKDDSVWEIQTENDDQPVPLPLREISGQRSEVNGKASTTNGVYMFFNMGYHTERYYSHNLDDVGPDRDMGLPSDRQGIVSALLSYPGRVFAAIDAGASGYSSILSRREGGWHEVYRAPKGERITNMHCQVVSGNVSRLWLTQGADLVFVPLPNVTYNPYYEPSYTYAPEGALVTAWITCDFLDVLKLFDGLKLFTDNLSTGQQEIYVDYQTETGSLSSGWTRVLDSSSVPDPYDTSPFELKYLKQAHDLTARRIRLRFVFRTSTNTETPMLKAWVLESLIRLPTRYSYSFLCLPADEPQDMRGVPTYTTRAETTFATLDSWSRSPTKLTFRNMFSPYDNKNVTLEEGGARPVTLITDAQRELHVLEVTLLEIHGDSTYG